jgi:hypothetical protein
VNSPGPPAPGVAPLEPAAADHVGTAVRIAFTSEMRLLGNPFLWWDLAKVVGLSVLGMYAAVFLASLWIDPTEPLLLPPVALPIAAAGLLVLFVLACLIMGDRWTYTVAIGDEGIGWSVGERDRRINRVVGALNVMSGRPSGMGASAIAISQEDDGLTWGQIHRANYHEAARVISLRDSWHVVQRLYVPADSWPEVAGAIGRGIEEGAQVRAHQAAEAPAPQRNRLAVAAVCGLVVLATLASQAWYLLPDEARGPGIFAGVLALTSVLLAGPLRRIPAALALAAAGWFTVLTVAEAQEPFVSFFTGAATPTWTLDTPQLAFSLAGGTALAAVALVRLLGRARMR